jgi:hypothetical protein
MGGYPDLHNHLLEHSMEQDPYYRTLRMRRFWRHYGLIGFVIGGASMLFAFIRGDSLSWYLPAVTAIALAVVYWLRMNRLVRCPQCSRRLKPRKCDELYRVKGSKRFLYDCHSCKITWDSQFVDEPMSNT